jgi:hypothetical protein
LTVSGTSLHPDLQLDAMGQQNAQSLCPYSDPVTGTTQTGCNAYYGNPYMYGYSINNAISVPVGTWFEVEFYIKRSTGLDGRVFAAINGQTVADFNGPNYGADLDEIQDMYWQNLYSNLIPASWYIDDFEVWSASPCTTLPCGTVTGAGGGYGGAVPPAITSWRGAIGAVGTPFYYQIKGTGGPTSYSTGFTGLPAGLSLNTSTGLISGTPTTAGKTLMTMQANNSVGSGKNPLTIQINNGIVTPVIRNFMSGVGIIQWDVMGTGNVTLFIDPGVGTITNTNNQAMSGSVRVSPTSTTTYTLTATNSAGSVSKSVTVTVAGSTGPYPPTGLTAIVH